MKKSKFKLSVVHIMIMMIFMISILSYINKDKLDIDIIKGNNEALGDVNLIYHPGNSVLNTTNIELSKDGIKNKFNLKENNYRDYLDIDKRYSKIVKYSSDVFYQNKYYIGNLTFYHDFEEDIYTEIRVTQINKNTNKEQIIKIPLSPNENSFKNNYITPRFMTIINDEVYIISDKAKGGGSDLLLMKINLKEKNYKILKDINLVNESNEEYINDRIFLYDNKIYTEISHFDSKREYTYFLIYDIKNDTLTKSDEFMNKIEKKGSLLKQNIFDYKVIEDKLEVVIGDGKGNISKLTYKISDKNVKLIENLKYNLNLGYTQAHVNSGKVKVKFIDDKLYSLVTPTAKIQSENNKYIGGFKHTEFTIFDTHKKEVIYKANLSSGSSTMDTSLFFNKRR